jgi:hypothetical protein
MVEGHFSRGEMQSIPLVMAGHSLTLHTDSARIGEVAAGFFPSFGSQSAQYSHATLSMRECKRKRTTRSACSFPIFRGRREYVHADYGRDGSVWFDLKARAVSAILSDELIADADYFRRAVLAVIAGILAPSLGLVCLHAGCVVRNGKAVLLAAASGVGKSTLTLALAQRGWSLLSDEWTFVSGDQIGLRTWGMRTSLKLMPDAVRYFPELSGRTPALALNGEMSFEVDPWNVFRVARAIEAEPKAIIFLARDTRSCLASHCHVKQYDSGQTLTALVRDLEEQPAEACEVNDARPSLMKSLSAIPSLNARFCGHPAAVAAQLDPILTELVCD